MRIGAVSRWALGQAGLWGWKLEKRSAGGQRLIGKAMAIGMTLAFFKRMHKSLRILNKKTISQILKNDYTENWVKWTLRERHGRKRKRPVRHKCLLGGIIKVTVL